MHPLAQLRLKLVRTFTARSVIFLALMNLALVLTACEPKHQAVDERQASVRSANTSLQRIEAIQAELKKNGIALEKSDATGRLLLVAREKELLFAKQRLEEFVSNAENVIQISNRSDVMWSGRDDLTKRLQNAKWMLEQINDRVQAKPGALSADFRERREACLLALQNGIEINRTVVWHYLHSFDEKKIEGFSRDDKAALAMQIRYQMECNRAVQLGYRAQIGQDLTIPIRPDEGSKFEPLIRKLTQTP